jgi:UDP-N-acetylglucosamine--N-acetylmuramyl-(pentapeptide) pyrophosphoryl-undecaprenol N-acetylglucosamine transferase
MSAVYILAAGGTGGHMFPAEAFAAELRQRGLSPVLITDDRGVPFSRRPLSGFSGIPVHTVRAGTLSRRRPVASARALVDILSGIVTAYRIQKPLKPALVVGFGGYPSLPAMIAARWAGVPRLIHEQNAVLGLANRLLAPRVKGVATSFDTTHGVRPADRDKVRVTGNPVRSAIAYIGGKPYPAPAEGGKISLLVTGGSLGARVMGDVVPAGIGRIPKDLRARISVVQQCRNENLDQVRAAYGEAAVEAELLPFIDNMSERLAHAHLVISRAGASTVAELTASGRPALLVPYPGHGDQQQTVNGAAVVDAGGAWLVEESEFTPQWVADKIEALVRKPSELVAAAGKARSLGRSDAAAQLADFAEHLAGREAA